MPMFVFPLFWVIPILFRGASELREAEYVTRPIVRLVLHQRPGPCDPARESWWNRSDFAEGLNII